MKDFHTREPAGSQAFVTRRGLLVWGAAATALAVSSAQSTYAVSAQGFQAGAEDALPMQQASAVGRLKEETAPQRWPVSGAAVRPPARRREPSRAAHPALAAPVFSLSDFVRRTPGTPAFPHNAVLLTIDDGPHPVWTPKILRLLHRYDVPATFYVIGSQAKQYPALVRATVSEGHQVANHSYSHPVQLPWLPAAAITAQLIDTQDAIVSASGFTPRQFRSPGGRWSPRMMRIAAAHDLLPIDWNVDPRDWSRPGSGYIVDAMLAAGPGDVLLCHDGGGDRSETYDALKIVLPQLKARGLKFVTLPGPKHRRS